MIITGKRHPHHADNVQQLDSLPALPLLDLDH